MVGTVVVDSPRLASQQRHIDHCAVRINDRAGDLERVRRARVVRIDGHLRHRENRRVVGVRDRDQQLLHASFGVSDDVHSRLVGVVVDADHGCPEARRLGAPTPRTQRDERQFAIVTGDRHRLAVARHGDLGVEHGFQRAVGAIHSAFHGDRVLQQGDVLAVGGLTVDQLGDGDRAGGERVVDADEGHVGFFVLLDRHRLWGETMSARAVDSVRADVNRRPTGVPCRAGNDDRY